VEDAAVRGDVHPLIYLNGRYHSLEG
jgi:hypothetical protein